MKVAIQSSQNIIVTQPAGIIPPPSLVTSLESYRLAKGQGLIVPKDTGLTTIPLITDLRDLSKPSNDAVATALGIDTASLKKIVDSFKR